MPGPALQFLESLPRFAHDADAYRPGLERVRRLLRVIGDPHLQYPSVHIAGTNGKGSTAAMVAAIGTAAGLRTGLHTSPHLVLITERMRIDGAEASSEWLESTVSRFRQELEEIGPSFFEATVALSLLYFAEQEVDLAIVEVGMGGRLDATNVLDPRVCVVTSIGWDHAEYLGNTLEAIAREKAGIAKGEVTLLCGESDPAVRAAIADEAAARGCRFEFVNAINEGNLSTPVRSYANLSLDLKGAHQMRNAALAVRAAEIAFDPPEFAIREGLAHTSRLSGLRGRTEVVQTRPLIMLDVAHNPDGVQAAIAAVDDARDPDGTLTVILGLMADKDARGVADVLSRSPARIKAVELVGERSLGREKLEIVLAEAGARPSPLAAPTVSEALAAWRASAEERDAVLITGSHVTVAAFLTGGGPG
ncbi:Mur ligase family protein [soil metagenome]